VAVENRLSSEELAALAPGDTVTIEVTSGTGRPKLRAGVVGRIAGSRIFVKVQSRHGGTYTEEYRLPDGVRVGGLARAELVNPHVVQPLDDEAQRRTRQFDAAYRQWARNRADSENLRRLQEAIGACLQT